MHSTTEHPGARLNKNKLSSSPPLKNITLSLSQTSNEEYRQYVLYRSPGPMPH